MRYMELRLFVNIYGGLVFVIVSFIISCTVVSFSLSIFCRLGSLKDSLMFFFYYIYYIPQFCLVFLVLVVLVESHSTCFAWIEGFLLFPYENREN
jgi:hypothetical protein